MQTTPFHARPHRSAAPDFWHDSTQCDIGQRILPAQRQVGVGAATRHCPWCSWLNKPLRNPCTPHVGMVVVRAQSRCKAAIPSPTDPPLT